MPRARPKRRPPASLFPTKTKTLMALKKQLSAAHSVLRTMFWFKTDDTTLGPLYRYLFWGILCIGISHGIYQSVFNNYLYDRFQIGAQERGLLEVFREMPGLMLMFVTAFMAILPMYVWGACVGLFCALAALGLAYWSPTYAIMVPWLMLFSLGEHLFMPVESAIGLQVSREKKEGRGLGLITGQKNLATILGAIAVWLGMEKLNCSYAQIFLLTAIVSVGSAYCLFHLKIKGQNKALSRQKFVFRKEYTIFYLLNILFGARKQLFLTFGPWVLISCFAATPQVIAKLYMIAAFLGFFFRQFIGEMVDRFGERLILMVDALVLVVISLTFAWANNFYILATCFIIDGLFFATRIARTTYLAKITPQKDEFAATFSMGVSLDHLVAMGVPVAGGFLWHTTGHYAAVFISAAVIAILNFICAYYLKIPAPKTSTKIQPPLAHEPL